MEKGEPSAMVKQVEVHVSGHHLMQLDPNDPAKHQFTVIQENYDYDTVSESSVEQDIEPVVQPEGDSDIGSENEDVDVLSVTEPVVEPVVEPVMEPVVTPIDPMKQKYQEHLQKLKQQLLIGQSLVVNRTRKPLTATARQAPLPIEQKAPLKSSVGPVSSVIPAQNLTVAPAVPVTPLKPSVGPVVVVKSDLVPVPVPVPVPHEIEINLLPSVHIRNGSYREFVKYNKISIQQLALPPNGCLEFTMDVPHNLVTLVPHLHWAPSHNMYDLTENMCLTFIIRPVGEVFGDSDGTTPNTFNQTVVIGPTNAKTHVRTDFDKFTPSKLTGNSHVVMGHLQRVTVGSSYTDDIFVVGLDFTAQAL